eukprot:gene18257-biopygen18954
MGAHALQRSAHPAAAGPQEREKRLGTRPGHVRFQMLSCGTRPRPFLPSDGGEGEQG